MIDHSLGKRQAILDVITLRPRHLFELSGEASAGKTQLCLQLVARAVLSGSAGRNEAGCPAPGTLNRAVYLFTEGGTAKMDRQCMFHAASAPRFFLFDSVHHLSLLFLTGN